ncbi:Sphingosine kinase 1 [Phytophthora ramorum]|uniref:DAGKc domain-containing protein n=1 Tax=Phytophthora ramorum TaxID=164328 RepID=H3H1N9_PHYRM|nr:Sphingosine kinase 1 [Phytophthora ramorum]KAH7488913.1 Sphingosine kinase 1 [Phytophthora ramorum]
MSPLTPTSLTNLLEHLHLESSQAPDERFAWLHRRSQHSRHPLVQFDFSETHCTLHIVPKRLRRRPDRRHKSVDHEKPATGNSGTSSSSEEDKPRDPIFMELKWEEVLGAHLQTACGQPLCRRSIVPRRVYLLALYACPPEGLLIDESRQRNHHHKDDLPTKRSLREWTFRFYGDEIDRVTQLHHALNRFADPRCTLEDIHSQALLKPDEAISRPLRKFRVLIDPNEGSGWGLHKYEQIVAPMFRVANIETTVEVTGDAERVRELAKQLPLDHFEVVALAGGDSFLHEFIQGLMARPDWKHAIRQPLGILPIDSGSSNGLAASVSHHNHEYLDVVSAAFALVKGRATDLDITSVSNGTETRYSFLKLEWALSKGDQSAVPAHTTGVLGDLRHTMSIRRQIARTPAFSGRIWYLRQDADAQQPRRYLQEHADEDEQAPCQDLFSTDLGRGKWMELQGPFRSAWVTSTSHATPSAFVAPGAQLDDGYTYVTVIDGTHPRSEVWRMLFSLESGRHLKRPAVQQIGTRALKLQPARATDRLCVDGHPMSGPSLIAQVHRGLARIVALPRQRQRGVTYTG